MYIFNEGNIHNSFNSSSRAYIVTKDAIGRYYKTNEALIKKAYKETLAPAYGDTVKPEYVIYE